MDLQKGPCPLLLTLRLREQRLHRSARAEEGGIAINVPLFFTRIISACLLFRSRG